MNLLRYSLSWSLFWFGHFTSRGPITWVSWFDPDDKSKIGEWLITHVLYPAYNNLMMWSYDIQGATPYGPWRPAKQPSDTNEQEP